MDHHQSEEGSESRTQAGGVGHFSGVVTTIVVTSLDMHLCGRGVIASASGIMDMFYRDHAWGVGVNHYQRGRRATVRGPMDHDSRLPSWSGIVDDNGGASGRARIVDDNGGASGRARIIDHDYRAVGSMRLVGPATHCGRRGRRAGVPLLRCLRLSGVYPLVVGVCSPLGQSTEIQS